MIPVTRPFLPPAELYLPYVRQIFERNILTNNGPLVKTLEAQLRQFLQNEHLLFVSNGTIALQMAIKSLGRTGEIITTPFSYVATTSSIVWESCIPVFVDIDTQSWNLQPALIEAAINDKTVAILATHVFGNPCAIEEIAAIGQKYNLTVIYDGAHTFGTEYRGKSLFNYGDISTASFHATKLFHTTEGGAVIVNSSTAVLERIRYFRNFGHDGPERFNGVGINGKNSEFHAAMGLCNLPFLEEILAASEQQSVLYDQLLEGLGLQKQRITPGTTRYNHAYYPMLFPSEIANLSAIEALNAAQIFPRRYFYPSLSSLDYLTANATPIADDISKRVLCLPLYYGIETEGQERIAAIISKVLSD